MDWTYNTIWFEQLPEGEFQHVMFGKKTSNWEVPPGSYYIIDDYKPRSKSLRELKGLSSPKYLELIRSNIHSFNWLDHLGTIKRIELKHCIKLESLEGIAELRNDLEWLHINTSRKLSVTNELTSLKNLKVLCLNSCGPIGNLDFLYELPELIDFRFVDTNIIDGNLRPIFEHPKLLNVGFLNKRHYNVTEKEADAYFDSKGEAGKVWVSKESTNPNYLGTFKTFKYRSIVP